MTHRTTLARTLGVLAVLTPALLFVACGAEPPASTSERPDASLGVEPQGSSDSVDAAGPDATVDSSAAPPPTCPGVDSAVPVCPACPVCDLDAGAPTTDAATAPSLGRAPYFWRDGGIHINYLAVGDSITAGAELIPGNGSPNPAAAYPALAARRMGSHVTVSDIGQLGWTLQQMLDAGVGEAGTLTTWLRGTPQNTINILSLMGGDNDIHYDASANEMEDRIHEYVRQAHAHGWLVVVCTLPPMNYPSWTAWQPAEVNAWIRSGGSEADGTCEFDDPIMQQLAPPSDVHPTLDGHVWMADRLVEGMVPVLLDAGAR